MRILPRNDRNRLMFASVAGRTFPLLHCHAGSVAILDHRGYSYNEALIGVRGPVNEDSSVLVIGNIGIFPSRVRTILLRGNCPTGCRVVIRHMGRDSAVRILIRVAPRVFSSSLNGVARVRGSLMSTLGTVLNVCTGMHLIRPGAVTEDRNGTIHMVSGEGVWKKGDCKGRAGCNFS